MSSFLTECRQAVRQWSRRPGLAITVVVTLALGIGATTAIFSVVDGVLLRPLPWQDADRLVTIWKVRPQWRNDPVAGGFWNTGVLSWPNVRDLREQSRTLEDVSVALRPFSVVVEGAEEVAQATMLASGFLPLLGVQPYAGRTFTAQEDAGSSDSIIISYESWQRRFGGVGEIVGRRVTIENIPRTIVGIIPPRFRFDSEAIEFFIPYGVRPPRERAADNNAFFVVARLKPGATIAEATADVEPILRGNADPSTLRVRVAALEDEQLGSSRTPLLLLLGASALLLLIACANVAGLLLGDADSRRQEVAVRSALGAARLRIVRQSLAESTVLGISGALGGVAVTWAITPALVALAPARLPRIDTVAVDLRVLAFALGLSIVTIVVFGAWPSLTMAGTDPADALRDGRGMSRRHRAHGGMVIGQIALAVVLLVGASLLAETLLRLTSQPLGFDPSNLMVVSVRPITIGAEGAVTRADRRESLVQRVRELPGVTGAALTSAAPFGGNYNSNTIEIDQRPGELVNGQRFAVDEHFFATMGMPIVRGRGFQSADVVTRWLELAAGPEDPLNGTAVAVVSEEFDRRYYGGRGIGRRFRLGPVWITVIGVVPDSRLRRYTEEPLPAFYLFSRQAPSLGTAQIVVRIGGDPRAIVPELRQAIVSSGGQLAITVLETMDTLTGRTVAGERYRALLSSMFGLAALVLASIGVYGILTRTVADREREIGIRMALGARPAEVLALVARDGGRLVAAGLIVGVPMALGLAHFIRSQLFGVEPTAPHIIAVACLVLGGAALVATLMPARRACRVDPILPLRAN